LGEGLQIVVEMTKCFQQVLTYIVDICCIKLKRACCIIFKLPEKVAMMIMV